MTMPHLMNCPHQPDGRCPACEAVTGERGSDIEFAISVLRASDCEAAAEAVEDLEREAAMLRREWERLNKEQEQDKRVQEARKAHLAAINRANTTEREAAGLRAALEEISRDAWSGDKTRMNSIGRAADKALAGSAGKEH